MSEEDQKAGAELLTFARGFIETQRITCAETVYQTDRVIENAYEFIEGVCKIAGYAKSDDEDEE